MHAKTLIAPAVAALVAGLAVPAAQAQFTQVNRVFVDDLFGAGSSFGTNPSAVAFDGTTAYVGGFNNSGVEGNVGVVAVSDLFGTFGSSTKTGLAGTLRSVPAGRAIEGVAYDAATTSFLTATSTGPSTGVLSRYTTAGANVFDTVNPDGVRPFAVGADPLAPGGDSSLAAFLTSGSGRRLGVDIDDGSLVYARSGENAGGVIFDGALNTTFRGLDFKSDGDLAYATRNGFAVYDRTGLNSFAQTSAILSGGADNIGRDIAFLEGAGPDGGDLLAIVARDSASLGGTSISDTNVFITDLQGNIVQTLTGSESGLSAAFANDTKSLDYAIAPDGTPTLVITDFVERRLDVYQIPEPTTLALAGLGGLTLLRRRRV